MIFCKKFIILQFILMFLAINVFEINLLKILLICILKRDLNSLIKLINNLFLKIFHLNSLTFFKHHVITIFLK